MQTNVFSLISKIAEVFSVTNTNELWFASLDGGVFTPDLCAGLRPPMSSAPFRGPANVISD